MSMSRVKVERSTDLLIYDPPTGRMTVEGLPVTYHCNVFNHFFARGVKLALGEEEGREVLYRASEFAHYRLFRKVKERYGLNDRETYALGMDYFRSRGLGVLDIKGPDRIHLLSSTHAYTYLNVMRALSNVPVCDAERGFIAGLLEAALDAEPGEIRVEETSCIGTGDPICRMKVSITGKKANMPQPDYGKVVFYPVEGAEEREKTMERLIPMIPEPDDSGIISLRSAFTDIRKVWISQLPGEYYAHANMRVVEAADPETARYTLTLAGFNCIFFTYVSIAHSPIGEVFLEGVRSPEDYFLRLVDMGNYFGFGVLKVEKLEVGDRCDCDVRLYNFYENSYLLALGKEAVSYFLLGAVLAQALATYRYRYYERDSLGSIRKIFEDFDEAYERMEVEMSFDPLKNEQKVGMSLPIT